MFQTSVALGFTIFGCICMVQRWWSPAARNEEQVERFRFWRTVDLPAFLLVWPFFGWTIGLWNFLQVWNVPMQIVRMAIMSLCIAAAVYLRWRQPQYEARLSNEHRAKILAPLRMATVAAVLMAAFVAYEFVTQKEGACSDHATLVREEDDLKKI
jgi:hypothetical protein